MSKHIRTIIIKNDGSGARVCIIHCQLLSYWFENLQPLNIYILEKSLLDKYIGYLRRFGTDA